MVSWDFLKGGTGKPMQVHVLQRPGIEGVAKRHTLRESAHGTRFCILRFTQQLKQNDGQSPATIDMDETHPQNKRPLSGKELAVFASRPKLIQRFLCLVAELVETIM